MEFFPRKTFWQHEILLNVAKNTAYFAMFALSFKKIINFNVYRGNRGILPTKWRRGVPPINEQMFCYSFVS